MLDAVEQSQHLLLCSVQMFIEEHQFLSVGVSLLLGRTNVQSDLVLYHCAARLLSWSLHLNLIIGLQHGHLALLLAVTVLLTRFDHR